MSYNVCVLTDKKDNQCFLWQCITHPETKLLLLFSWVILVESLCVNPIYCWSSVHLFCLQIDCRSVVLTCELIQFFQRSLIFFWTDAYPRMHWAEEGNILAMETVCLRSIWLVIYWQFKVCSGHTKQLMISAPAKDTVLLLKVKFYCVLKKKNHLVCFYLFYFLYLCFCPVNVNVVFKHLVTLWKALHK